MERRNAEILAKYQSTIPTPEQINKHIHGDVEYTAHDVWLSLDYTVMMEFVSNTGNLKEKKIGKFLKSVDTLMDSLYPFKDLIKLSAECIEHDGRINLHTFNDFLQKKNQD
jgi:hypothetical protein